MTASGKRIAMRTFLYQHIQHDGTGYIYWIERHHSVTEIEGGKAASCDNISNG